MARFSSSVTTVLFCLALFTAGATTAAAARPAALAPVPAPTAASAAWMRLAERMDAEAGPQQCWETLMQIKSCTGEIILFFLNGEAYLGPGCCRAIVAIEQSCWAADAMLSVIGFTPQEGDMLKGYCDAGDEEGQQLNGAPQPPPRRAVLDDGDNSAAAAARDSVVVGSLLAGRKQGPVHGL